MKKQRLAFLFANIAFFLPAGSYFILFLLGVIPSGFCPFFRLSGLYCPACGGTRAMAALLSGHILRSLLLNPASLCFALCVCYYEIALSLFLWRGKGKVSLWPLFLLAAVLVCQFAVRNLLLRLFGVDLIGDVLPPPAFVRAL